EATLCYRRAAQLEPNSFRWTYYLAAVEGDQGRCDTAISTLRLALHVHPDYPPAELRLANCLLASADWDASGKLYAEIVEQHRDTYQVQYGAELEKQGKLEESLAAHEKALEIDPQLVQAHINLIELYGRLGQFDKAEGHYLAAIRIDQGSAESYYNYGVLLLSAEKFHSAEEAFRKTIDINPFYAGAHNNLGYLLERRGNFSEAETEYRRAIENKPSDRQAHFNLGRILVNQKKYQEGIQELERTLEPEDENTPRYIYALGAAFARAGDRE